MDEFGLVTFTTFTLGTEVGAFVTTYKEKTVRRAGLLTRSCVSIRLIRLHSHPSQ